VVRAWSQRLVDRAQERAQVERSRHGTVDAVFEMVDHDAEVGGSIMAGALAYRLFIWLLPLALVAVAGLGIASSAASRSPESAARSAGLAGLVSSSVATAADSPARWYALLIGIPVLIYATRSLLRALVVTHRLIWMDLRGAAPKPTIGATLRLLGALIGLLVVSALASAARAWSPGSGVLVLLLIPLPFAALWLLISVRLPHRTARWQALVPGAIAFGAGVQLLNAVIAYVIAPQAASKHGTYGSLGIAAALLLGLFLISRLVTATAVLNAILWKRSSAGGRDRPRESS
jgi:uncharacterized BrkB/YihY/UPF0761 family membrane protein